MSNLSSLLTAPVRAYDVYSDAKPVGPSSVVKHISNIPAYGKRVGWTPKSQADYGDGGAYPEVNVPQYPLDMGRPGRAMSTAIVPVNVDATTGKARFDAIVTAQHRDKAKVHSTFNDLVEKRHENVVRERPTLEEEAEAAAKTRAALEGIVTTKIQHSRPGYVPEEAMTRAEQSKYIRYSAESNTAGFTEATSQRIIRMVEAPVDPLEPPKFKHKKVPGGPADAPVPLMHSPPRKLTVADQQAWSVPACVSNWKNARGYIVPLDKRLAADGRSLLEPVINDKFATVSESLLIAERKARVEVETRAAIERKLALKEKEDKEAELRNMAAKARMERIGAVNHNAPSAAVPSSSAHDDDEQDFERPAASRQPQPGGRHEPRGAPADIMEEDDDKPQPRQANESAQEYAARMERERLRRERKRERERDLRMENMGGKRARMMKGLDDRDVSEKVALGLPVGRIAATNSEAVFDTRLFNQTEGIASGLADDDAYNVYSKAWRTEATGSSIYRPRTSGNEELSAAEADAQVRSLQGGGAGRNTDFEGVDRSRKGPARSEPVQFEKQAGGDVFGLDQYLSQPKKGGGSGALDTIGKSAGHGFMAAAAGSVGKTAEDYARPGRDRIAFTSAGKQQ